MNTLLYSLGWRLLRQALSWLLTDDVRSAIRVGVAALLSVEMPGAEKHAAVVSAAQAVQARASTARPKELIEIAVKAAYLEVTEQQST